MSKTNSEGAFPIPEIEFHYTQCGMSIRQWYKGMALSVTSSYYDAGKCVDMAARVADLAIAEDAAFAQREQLKAKPEVDPQVLAVAIAAKEWLTQIVEIGAKPSGLAKRVLEAIEAAGDKIP